MHRLQELVRLHRAGASGRALSRQLRMSRNTLRSYKAALSAAQLLDGEPDQLPALDVLKATVQAHLPAKTPPQETSSVAQWADHIERMVKEGNSPKVIFDYLTLEVEGFDGSYYAVKRLARKIKDARGPNPNDIAIPVTTKPGQVAQVDFFEIGKLRDPETGKMRRAWAFVMLLAHSRHMFVDIVFDQKAVTWQRLHARAFLFFGGVPAVIVPDNLKAAVIRAAFNSSGEIALNRSYVELARHYKFQVDPAPAYAPKKKGKVERAGRYFRDSYIAPRNFDDIEHARRGINGWVRQIAGQRIHGVTGRRPLEVFEHSEQAALRPLPDKPFIPTIWHRSKVHNNAHIQFQRHLYSVPWRLVGRRLWLRADDASVIVFHEDARVATHRRGERGGRTTHAGHLPRHRQAWRFRDRVYWEEQAALLGDEVALYVGDLFDADDVLSQLRKVQSVVSFLADYPPERRAAACKRARFYGVTSVRIFKDILRKNLDLEAVPREPPKPHGALATPRFARGADAFLIHPQPMPEA